MEIFIGSLAVFLLSALGLMVGQLFGRGPIKGGCVSEKGCANAGHCSLQCVFRRRAGSREKVR